MEQTLWQDCLEQLQSELSAQHFNTWIKPLQAVQEGSQLILLAPNQFVLDWIRERYLARIAEIARTARGNSAIEVSISIGTANDSEQKINGKQREPARVRNPVPFRTRQSSGLQPSFTFDSFVEGKSNQFARAASLQAAENCGKTYNPLFIYGGVGLGKTHLMHAVGNCIGTRANAQVIYVHSERFVSEMVRALQHNAINEFKRFYRSVDALLIDDIQFFANKERSQEEFFHTFNTLLEGQQQIVLTCDRYPKEVSGVEERLKSRFSWGLTVAIEPPELETRVAILKSKAAQKDVLLPDEVAFFIAKRFRSNIRELEGTLHRVIANAHFTGRTIDVEFAKDALRDLLAVQDKAVSVDNIKLTVAEFYKMRVGDLASKSRSRSVTRPRQMAMALSKELTNHSLPEIGDRFGGRDHTTVIHACKTIATLRLSDDRINEDYTMLKRILTG